MHLNDLQEKKMHIRFFIKNPKPFNIYLLSIFPWVDCHHIAINNSHCSSGGSTNKITVNLNKTRQFSGQIFIVSNKTATEQYFSYIMTRTSYFFNKTSAIPLCSSIYILTWIFIVPFHLNNNLK